MWSMSDWKTVCITFLLILKAAVTNPDSGVHAWHGFLWKSICHELIPIAGANIFFLHFCICENPHLRSKYLFCIFVFVNILTSGASDIILGISNFSRFDLIPCIPSVFTTACKKTASKSVSYLVETKRGEQDLEYLDDVVVLAELVVVRVSLPEVSCELFQSASNRHHHCHGVWLQDKEK